MDLKIRLATTWGFIWKRCVKLLVESSRSKRSQKCSKTIPKRPIAKRWDYQMKVDFKKSKENFRFEFGLKNSQ
jgi:hypothetical protein